MDETTDEYLVSHVVPEHDGVTGPMFEGDDEGQSGAPVDNEGQSGAPVDNEGQSGEPVNDGGQSGGPVDDEGQSGEQVDDQSKIEDTEAEKKVTWRDSGGTRKLM